MADGCGLAEALDAARAAWPGWAESVEVAVGYDAHRRRWTARAWKTHTYAVAGEGGPTPGEAVRSLVRVLSATEDVHA